MRPSSILLLTPYALANIILIESDELMSDATQSGAQPTQATESSSIYQEPLTDELLKELLAAPCPVAFTDAHEITTRSVSEYLSQVLTNKGLKRSAVIKAAGINETFGYQIFTGARNASRDNLIKIAFAMKMNLLETNRLLKAGGVNELYCKNRRDAIIIFSIDHAYSLQQTEEELYRFREATLN